MERTLVPYSALATKLKPALPGGNSPAKAFMTSRLRYCIFVLCLISVNITPIYSQWQRIALLSEAVVRQIKVVDDTTLLAVANNGIYRSTDNGLQWHITYKRPTLAIGNVGTTLITGTLHSGIFTSNDNGETWISSQVQTPTPQFFLTKGSRIFAQFDGGVFYYSDDAGKKWHSITAIPVWRALVGAIVDNTIFIGFSHYSKSDTRVFASSDDGRTWDAIGPEFTGYSLCTVGSQLFAGSKGSVFRSDDKGKSWTEFHEGLPDDKIVSIAWNGTYLFAALEYSGVVRSVDGTSWQPCSFPISTASHLAVNGSQIIASTGIGIYYTSDNGETWTQKNNEVVDIAGRQRMSTIAMHSRTLYTMETNGAIYTSYNLGDGWQKFGPALSTSASVTDLAFAGNRYILAGTKGIFLSDDHGTTLFEPSQNITLSSSAIVKKGTLITDADETTLFVGTADTANGAGGVFYSTDAGITWNAANITVEHGGVKAMCVHQKKLFMSSELGIFVSADKGATWKQLHSGLPEYAAASILKIADRNAWNADNRGVFAVIADSLFASYDGGETWSNISQDMPPMGISDMDVTESYSYLLCAGEKGIYLSQDRGSSWQDITGNLRMPNNEPIPVNALITLSTDEMYIATDGYGVWRRPLYDFGIMSVSEPGGNTSTPAYTLSPHPVASTSLLQLCSTCELHNATLSLSTISGQHVRTMGNLYGTSVSIERGDLAAGVYAFTLTEAGRIVASGTIVVE